MSAWQRRLQLALIACAVVALGAVQLASALSIGRPPTRQEATSLPTGNVAGPIPRIALAYTSAGADARASMSWPGRA